MRGFKFWPTCSALMAIEQWGILSVPHLLWHRASVYNGHLRGPVTLTLTAERLAVESVLLVFTTKLCRSLDSNTQTSACGTNALTYCATAEVGYENDINPSLILWMIYNINSLLPTFLIFLNPGSVWHITSSLMFSRLSKCRDDLKIWSDVVSYGGLSNYSM